MPGKWQWYYKGVQALILKENPLAIYGPCATHSLNVCGVHASQCWNEVITFLISCKRLIMYSAQVLDGGKSCRNMFPVRCTIFQRRDGRHELMLSNRFPVIYPNLVIALKELIDGTEVTVKPEVYAEVKRIIKFLKIFECLLLSSIWLKVLSIIEIRNKVLQIRSITLDRGKINWRTNKRVDIYKRKFRVNCSRSRSSRLSKRDHFV